MEYDLLSGQFLNVQLGPGKNNDKTYGTICLETVEAGDLCLRDLGYFDLGDLQAIHEKQAYYISRLKLNTRIYIKNPEPEYFNNGTLKKQTEYIQLDMAQMMSDLTPGETMEIPEAYIGQNQKLPARVMIHRLTDDQTQTRLKNQAIREKKKGIVMKDKSKRLMGMNVISRTHRQKKYRRTTCIPCIHCVGRLRFCLKHGSRSLKSMSVKTSKRNA